MSVEGDEASPSRPGESGGSERARFGTVGDSEEARFEEDAEEARSEGDSEEARFEVDAEAVLFGFDPTALRVTILRRTSAWRVGGAARRFALFVVIAPFVAIIPPHAVWLLGSLVTGGVLARRRLAERFTLVKATGDCPRCGRAFAVKSGRLKAPHALPCEGCHHESALRLPDGVLAGADGGGGLSL